jgi:hypothetical protein
LWKNWKIEEAASASIAPVSVLLQLLVDAYGSSRYAYTRHAAGNQLATWFRSGGGSFMELLTV